MGNVYVKPIHPYAFRRESGELPLISGVYWVTPCGSKELEPRICYEVRYMSDNKVDFIPITEFQNGNYEFVDLLDKENTIKLK